MIEYNNWYEKIFKVRSNIVTFSKKNYSIDAISVYTLNVSKRKKSIKVSFDFEKIINKLILSFIKREVLNNIDEIIEFNHLSNFNNFDHFVGLITSNFTMFEQNFQNSNFIKQQFITLRIFINEFRIIFDEREKRGERDEFNFFDDNKNNERWNVQKINFFDFHYDEKIVVIAFAMKHVNKNIYFRDVHVFIEKVKNMIIIKEIKMIRNNLYIWLCNTTFKWYILILIKEQKFFVKHDDNVDY